MYIKNLKSRFNFAIMALGAGFVAMGASPAIAEAPAVPAESSIQSATGAAAPLARGDREFRRLFQSWEAIEEGQAAPAAKVSIPSRMPVDDTKLTSSYGMRTHPVLGGRRSHNGVDLASPSGTPVYATADGYVEMAEWFSSYGKFIKLDHGADLETRYAHLSQIAVSAGSRVEKGDLIGYVGSTGRSTGPHLHYEVRVGGEAVNPIPYMVETEAQQAYALAMGEGGRGGD
ncbi:M23 family metallopeptidase [Altererythrobacter aquiaggeris]|uniref:M23 family metallopeptidase n=1 Tax=Aestuarierythrobacter aquiaggeris TaxID=1898396 RepID=UPI0030190669